MPYLFLTFLFIIFVSPARAQISADHWLGGAVRVGPSSTPCDTSATGAIRFDSHSLVLKYCDGATWRTVGATISGADNTPDAFSFTDMTNQPLNTMVFSDVITIIGIDPDQTVSVTGAGTPQISINNGPWVTAASISAGDELQVRLISSGSISTARSAVVTVGSVSDTWSVTARAGQTYIFLTSTDYTGDFGGIAAADFICMTRANAASLPGVWKAVMSDDTTDAKDRLAIVYPVVNLNNSVVASVNFWSESLTARARTEFNADQGDSGNQVFWGGTAPGGIKAGNTCNNWTLAAGQGRTNIILTGQNIYGLYTSASQTCTTARRIACMQQ